MPRRRLSDQQRKRIQQRQDTLRQQHSKTPELPGGEAPTQQSGLVVAAFGAAVVLEDRHGALRPCRVRRTAGRPVCGDQVLWSAQHEAEGVVLALLPRHGELTRNDGTRRRLMAANVDRVAVVLTAQAGFQPLALDRALVAAELQGIAPLIVVNKTDLLDAGRLSQWQARLALYQLPGYPVLFTSVPQQIGLDELAAQLRGHTSLLLGASGVGKSSLARCLLPDRDIRIGAVSAAGGRGRHTTSSATLYHLPGGGDLIDAPGLSDFGPATVDPLRMAAAFPEFRPYLGTCKFRDCRHRDEPGCALRAAVDSGTLSASRLASLHALLDECDC